MSKLDYSYELRTIQWFIANADFYKQNKTK